MTKLGDFSSLQLFYVNKYQHKGEGIIKFKGKSKSSL